ncbi:MULTISPECIES: helix-turn-helix domain-containing protein [unclassified Chryseobacterium]|uniref:helix-turn-helix domain-containing protein n=1 Tax=unclassified Chryseobacterium TaxID=2593645 RepID=UPI00226A12FD|nr:MULTISPECIES: helix-turn-helix domain-containing protein [unclassified Chryseobacterium]
MQEIFKTFKPQHSTIKKYVDYYYLDIKPNNKVTEYDCFPHFNSTISLYQSHIRAENGEIIFNEKAKPFQIFTPIREKVLHVKQTGKVYRIVLVFHPLGIQQFYRNLNFADYILDGEFFNEAELHEIFSTTDTEILVNSLDSILTKRFILFKNTVIEQTLQFIFNAEENFSVAQVSEKVGISRQHLNRVFQLYLGVSVKKFYEIVLFRNTINKKLFENPDENFTTLAHEFNFNDQSHFNKIYKNLTQKSPTVFFNKGTILGKEDTFWHVEP